MGSMEGNLATGKCKMCIYMYIHVCTIVLYMYNVCMQIQCSNVNYRL